MIKRSKEKDISVLLVDAVVKGILDKSGEEIVSLNLGKIDSTVCDFFVICHGNSRPHVEAIAEAVEDTVQQEEGIRPARREGFLNGEWLLLDYQDVVVHIFQEPIRRYYQLEDLWADVPSYKFQEV
ncbi:MAG: ribosome silencing factor [Bacteroidales bacterium]